MKKTFTINISGALFHIEEDAYEKLQGYLLKLKEHFGNDAEGREIVADIENRISELFTEKAKGENRVISAEWVDEVISTMGTPEDFLEQEHTGEPLLAVKGRKRLYRATDNRVIGGVCSGLSAYFKVDPLVMRILFVVLFFANGIGLLAYLILWIAVPGAVTTAQKLEMRGEEVTISNIEKRVRDENPEMKAGQAVGVTGPSPAENRPGRQDDAGSRAAGSILKIGVTVIGIFLIVAGFLGLLGLISSLVVGHTFFSDLTLTVNNDFQVSGLLNQFISSGGVSWGLFLVALLAGIPLLAMLYVGTKLVFNYKSNNTAIGLAMVGIWLLALVGLVTVAAREAGNFKSNATLSGTETLYPTPGKTLYLKVAEDKFENFGEMGANLPRCKAVMADDKVLLLGEPRLDIEKSATNDFVLVIKKQSRGRTQSDANENIRTIVYNYQLADTVLTLDPWFLLGDQAKWRGQRLNMTLKVPEGAAVFLSDGMEEIVWDIDNVSNTWDGDMVGKTWIMLPEGLTMKESLEVKADSIK